MKNGPSVDANALEQKGIRPLFHIHPLLHQCTIPDMRQPMCLAPMGAAHLFPLLSKFKMDERELNLEREQYCTTYYSQKALESTFQVARLLFTVNDTYGKNQHVKVAESKFPTT